LVANRSKLSTHTAFISLGYLGSRLEGLLSK